MDDNEKMVKLIVALNKVQKELEPARKESENPFFHSRYADLTSVWNAVRKPLLDHGFAVVQSPEGGENGTVVVRTILMHEGGGIIEGSLSLTPKDQTPQAVGSCITYGRRYGLSAMVGVCPEDDDAEAAQSRPAPQVTAPKPQPAAKPSAGKSSRGAAGASLGTAVYTTAEYTALRKEYTAKYSGDTKQFIKWCEEQTQSDLKKPGDWNLEKISVCRKKLGAI